MVVLTTRLAILASLPGDHLPRRGAAIARLKPFPMGVYRAILPGCRDRCNGDAWTDENTDGSVGRGASFAMPRSGQPGKAELMLGMVEWLNHGNPLPTT